MLSFTPLSRTHSIKTDQSSILNSPITSNSNEILANTAKKKSSLPFSLLDSILSHSVAKPLTTKKSNDKSSTRLVSYNPNIIKDDEFIQRKDT